MAKPKNNWQTVKPFRLWNVNGNSPIGATMQYAGNKWIVINWLPKYRALTMVSNDASMSVSVIDPLCMQWEK